MRPALRLVLLSLLPVAACTDAATSPTSTTPPQGAAAADPLAITTTDLAALGFAETPVGVNNRGQVVGGCRDRTYGSESGYDGPGGLPPGGRRPLLAATQRALLWSAAGGVRDLGTLGGAAACAAAINESGQVVGYSRTATGEVHAFVWSAGVGMRDLGTLPGQTESRALDINASGQVVGWSAGPDDPRAVVWAADGTVQALDISPVPGPSRATAINDAGQVAGFYTPRGLSIFASMQYPFLWTTTGGGRLFRETSRDGFHYPRSINNRGTVVGGQTVSGMGYPLVVNNVDGQVSRGLDCPTGDATYTDVNDANVVTQHCPGVEETRAYIYLPGQPRLRLPAPLEDPGSGRPASASPFALNDDGAVVGVLGREGSGKATMWTVPGLPAPIAGPAPTPVPAAARLRLEPAGGVYRTSEQACGGRYTVCLRFAVAEGVAPYKVTIDWGDYLLGTEPFSSRVTYTIPAAGVSLLAPHDYAPRDRRGGVPIDGRVVILVDVEDARGLASRQIIAPQIDP